MRLGWESAYVHDIEELACYYDPYRIFPDVRCSSSRVLADGAMVEPSACLYPNRYAFPHPFAIGFGRIALTPHRPVVR